MADSLPPEPSPESPKTASPVRRALSGLVAATAIGGLCYYLYYLYVRDVVKPSQMTETQRQMRDQLRAQFEGRSSNAPARAGGRRREAPGGPGANAPSPGGPAANGPQGR